MSSACVVHRSHDSQDKDYFAGGMALDAPRPSVGSLGEGESGVHNNLELPICHQVGDHQQAGGLGGVQHEGEEAVLGEGELVVPAAEHSFESGRHVDYSAPLGQLRRECLEGLVGRQVHHHVVFLPGRAQVELSLRGLVIHHLVCSQFTHQVHVPDSTCGGHKTARQLRYLRTINCTRHNWSDL